MSAIITVGLPIYFSSKATKLEDKFHMKRKDIGLVLFTFFVLILFWPLSIVGIFGCLDE